MPSTMRWMDRIDLYERLDRLAKVSRQRGFSKAVPIGLMVAGLLPALLLTISSRPGYEGALLISGLVVLGPAALLLAWTLADGQGQAAREVVMWLSAVGRGSRTSDSSAQSAPSRAEEALSKMATASGDDEPLELTAASMRELLAPLVSSPRALKARLYLYRFWYPVAWTILTVPLVVLFLAVISFTQ